MSCHRLLLACAVLAGALSAQADDKDTVWWRAPPSPQIAWRGLVSLDGGAVAPGTQIGPYQVPNLAGLLVAIATHGAVAAGMQSAAGKRAQAEADRVLEPFQPALGEWPARALWDAALALPTAPPGSRVLDAAVRPDGAWLGEATPRIAVAPSAAILVLDVVVGLAPPGDDKPAEVSVRVVSAPGDCADASSQAAEDRAGVLKTTAAAMFAHALGVAVRQVRAAPDAAAEPAPRTHRYLLGGGVGSERGQLLLAGCGRIVLRTLRGGLLSVPVAGDPSLPCPDPYRM